MATRSAILGVSRYGSSTRGSGGRKRPPRAPVLAKEAHLPDALRPGRGRKQAPDECVDRPGQDQVERDPLEQGVDQNRARRRRLAEDEVQGEGAERVKEGDQGYRDERRVRAVASGRLAVAADPVADEREQDRGDPERGEVGGIGDESP